MNAAAIVIFSPSAAARAVAVDEVALGQARQRRVLAGVVDADAEVAAPAVEVQRAGLEPTGATTTGSTSPRCWSGCTSCRRPGWSSTGWRCCSRRGSTTASTTAQPDAEKRSAAWAAEALPTLVDQAVVDEVVRLVLITEHAPARRRRRQRLRALRRRPGDPGRAAPERYAEYVASVRGEYAQVARRRLRRRPRRDPARPAREAAPLPHGVRPGRLGGRRPGQRRASWRRWRRNSRDTPALASGP